MANLSRYASVANKGMPLRCIERKLHLALRNTTCFRDFRHNDMDRYIREYKPQFVLDCTGGRWHRKDTQGILCRFCPLKWTKSKKLLCALEWKREMAALKTIGDHSYIEVECGSGLIRTAPVLGGTMILSMQAFLQCFVSCVFNGFYEEHKDKVVFKDMFQNVFRVVQETEQDYNGLRYCKFPSKEQDQAYMKAAMCLTNNTKEACDGECVWKQKEDKEYCALGGTSAAPQADPAADPATTR